MTYVDEVEVRRTSVGTRVLAFACGILAVLGSFWGVVWFIRAYVEAPRVNIPAPIQLASTESRPVALPAPKVEATEAERAPTAPVKEAQTKPAPATPRSPPAAAPREPQGSAADAVADRWAPINQFATPAPPAPSPPAPAPQAEPPAAPEPAASATAPDAEPPVEEVAEGSVPAIAGPAPLPRRKPTMTAARRVETTPLPRPRPDGSTPQSVWTGVPSADERFNAQ